MQYKNSITIGGFSLNKKLLQTWYEEIKDFEPKKQIESLSRKIKLDEKSKEKNHPFIMINLQFSQ